MATMTIPLPEPMKAWVDAQSRCGRKRAGVWGPLGRMPYKTTVLAGEDIIRVYSDGVSSLGIDKAETCLAGLRRYFDLISEHPVMARERQEFTPNSRPFSQGAWCAL